MNTIGPKVKSIYDTDRPRFLRRISDAFKVIWLERENAKLRDENKNLSRMYNDKDEVVPQEVISGVCGRS